MRRSPGPVAAAVLLAALASPLAVPAVAQSRLADDPAAPASGWVIDRAGLLDAATVAALDSRLAAHERATGNQVVVETVTSLAGAPLEDFALAEATRLGIGQRGRDNGVLLLVALGDRQARIEVGYGLEATLTDALAGRILRREVVPRFRAGDYAGGIEAGVAAILGALEGSYRASPLERVPGLGSALARVADWYGGLPPVPRGDQAFLGLFLWIFGPILGVLMFAWLPWKKTAAGLGLTVFGVVALALLARYPWMLVPPVAVAVIAGLRWLDRRFLGGVLAKLLRAMNSAGAGTGSGSGSGSRSSSRSSWSSSSSSSSSSYSGGGGSFGGGGASSRW